jgi:hypothetical protein
MSTTEVDELINKIYLSDDSDDELDNLPSIVMNLSKSLDKRINSFEKYYEERGDNAIEILRTLSSMYQMSGSKLIEHFFYRICTHGLISPFLKSEAAKCILDYEEADDDRQEEIIANNIARKTLGYKALDHVCYDLSNMPTPCRVEAIFLLMNSDMFQTNADSYFREFIRSENIECAFRYTTILSLEKIGSEEMKQELELTETDILEKLYKYLSLSEKTKQNWKLIIRDLSYYDLKKVYKNMFPEKTCRKDFFIKKAQLSFFFYDKNPIYYRNISGQYLLKNCELSDINRDSIENQILEFAEDTELDYNLRADAADILLRFGSVASRERGMNVIMQLSLTGSGHIRTVFDNAQNVHTEEVEESVSEALEFLSSFSIYIHNNNPIGFEYVNSRIEKILKDQIRDARNDRLICDKIEKRCKYCECESDVLDSFCSENCTKLYARNEKIRISMTRIFIDRALYSKFNNTLLNILLKIYTYIGYQDNETRFELHKRMLEELEEMSGTCSSGFASRLVNIISGYGDFNIRISFKDQIIANFVGRLNAKARSITEDTSIFRHERLEDVVELWLLDKVRKELREEIELKLKGDLNKPPQTINLVVEFLSDCRDEKIEKCLEDFKELVLNEMAIKSSRYYERRNFALFFRSHVSNIREELAEEFKDLISLTDFDLYFRRAIMMYDGEKDI